MFYCRYYNELVRLPLGLTVNTPLFNIKGHFVCAFYLHQKITLTSFSFCISHSIKEITLVTLAFIYEKVSIYHDNDAYER